MRRLLVLLVLGITIGSLYFFIAPKLKTSFLPPDILKPQFAIISPSPTPPVTRKFAVMSDIHNDLASLQKALFKAKEDNVSFVIIAGDLTNTGQTKELTDIKKVLEQSGLKYYVIPGNHDFWATHNLKTNLIDPIFGPEFTSFKEGTTKFILISNGSYLWGINGVVSAAGQKQGDWLKNELKECPQTTCLVFAHMPLNHPDSSHIMGEGSAKITKEAQDYEKLFVKSQVYELFAGHLHFHSDYEFKGLKTIVTGAITSERNLQRPRFLEVLISNSPNTPPIYQQIVLSDL